VLPVVESARASSEWILQSADKELFVSPFAHMNMQYQFRFNKPDDKQVIVIKASDDQGVLITASYSAKRVEISASRLFGLFFKFPFQSIKVVAGIHWEALRLYFKGVPWFKHQPKSSS